MGTKIDGGTLVSVPAPSNQFPINDGTAGKVICDFDRGLSLLDFFGGRLTTETGVPVSTSDRTAQGTIYLTPNQALNSGLYRIFDGTRWRYYKNTSDLSLALTATSGKNYDAFLRWNAGTPALALSSAWTNDTTRADALALQDGIPVLSSDHTYRWCGTLRASATDQVEDSKTKRYVWSPYNQVERPQERYDTAHSHTYAGASFREWNAGTGITRLEFVVGAPQSVKVRCTVDINAVVSNKFPEAGGAINSTTAYNGFDTALGIMNDSTNIVRGGHATWNWALVGYNYVTVIEFGSSGGLTANQFSYYDVTCYTMG